MITRSNRLLWRLKVRAWRRGYRFLERADPDVLTRKSEEAAVLTFQRAAARVPFYRNLLKERGVDPKRVTGPERFRELVPVVDKHQIFKDAPLHDLCVNGSLKDVKSILASSGFSGVFSLGVNTQENQRHSADAIDAALDYLFQVGDVRTLIVNAVPMGVKIPTSLPCADVSVRGDMALAILKRLRPYYEQFIVVSDPHFMKKLVEDGQDQGVCWKDFPIHLVMGEDWFSETMRTYLAGITGADPDDPGESKLVGATMGVAELDLNIFHETRDTIRIRRLAERDGKLRHALFGETEITPVLFHYYPHRTHVELAPTAEGSREIVFTMLSSRMRIPLVRYNAGDCGYLFSHGEMRDILRDFGYESYAPRLRLPLVAVSGRAGRTISAGGARLTPEAGRSALYADPALARATTGQFWMSANNGRITFEVQLRPGYPPSNGMGPRLAERLGGGVDVVLVPYDGFPVGMAVDYERKFRHMNQTPVGPSVS